MMLIKQNVFVDPQDINGMTPLHLAIASKENQGT